jgi:hypothetical protein
MYKQICAPICNKVGILGTVSLVDIALSMEIPMTCAMLSPVTCPLATYLTLILNGCVAGIVMYVTTYIHHEN